MNPPSRYDDVFEFEDEQSVMTLRDHLRVLRRHRWVVVGVTFVVVLATVGVTLLRTPLYQSSTELLVEPFQRVEDAALDDLGVDSRGVATVQRLITSIDVRTEVGARLGLAPEDARLRQVQIGSVSGTRIVTIRAISPDPVFAASLSNTYAEAFLDVRRTRVLREVANARTSLDDQLGDIERSIVQLDSELAARVRSGADIGALQLERDVQFSRLSRLLEQRAALVQGADELSTGGQILQQGQVPRRPFQPQPVRDGLLGLLVGLLAGVALAFLRDYFQDQVRDELDVRRATGMRPLLGRIPAYKLANAGPKDRRVITLVEPHSIAAESYRELGTNVRYLVRRSPADGNGSAPAAASLMLISASANDGKSVTAVNLAVAAARAGQRVILVDGDLRRGSINAHLGLGRLRGLTDVMVAGSPVAEALVSVGVSGLSFLPAGTTPPNPADFLAGPAMSRAHEELLELADLIIYDTPAALAVPDALEIGRLVDGAVLLLQHEVSTRREITAVIERMEQVGVSVIGTILNNIRAGSDTYYYYYSYYHSSDYATVLPRERTDGPPHGVVREARVAGRAGAAGPAVGAGTAGTARGAGAARGVSRAVEVAEAVTVRRTTEPASAAPTDAERTTNSKPGLFGPGISSDTRRRPSPPDGRSPDA